MNKDYLSSIFQNYDSIYSFVDETLINVRGRSSAGFTVYIYTIDECVVFAYDITYRSYTRRNILCGGPAICGGLDHAWIEAKIYKLIDNLQEQINIPEDDYIPYSQYFNLLDQKVHTILM